MNFSLFFTIFPITLMTGGPIISLFYKDIFRNNDYYFFYNRGITKIHLLGVTFIFHVIFGILVLFIIKWVLFLK
jgi:hypothetical protein